jgi:formamidopyrimidine-DNA glycosylase
MPELPEVATVIKDLKAHSIVGKKVIFNRLINDVVFKTPFYNLSGLIIEKVERYGKYIVLKFSKSAMLIHLGMAGKLILDEGKNMVPEHTHWLIQIDDGWQIRYIDHRHFGKVWNMSYKDCMEYIQSRIGPEPFGLDSESFILRIRQNKYLNKSIKEILLDQKLIAGLGNIYASEACYEAFIHPKTLVKNLTDKQLIHMLYAIRKVLKKGIKNNGTTFQSFRNAKNKKGNNQNFLGVYKQKTCKRCTSLIQKEKIANRTTYWCETCQKLIGG